MADSYVTSGATLKCPFGDKSSKLTVYPDRTVFLTGKPMANISDHISMYNIASFGKCRTVSYPPTGSATAANNGRLTPMPCVPGTVSEWQNGKNDYIIKGKPALLKSSFCKCQWGGVITITDDAQVDTGAVDDSRVNRETEDEIKKRTEEALKVDPESVLDGIQLALDAAGLAPGIGAIPDLLNAGISAIRGDWGTAGLSVLAAVPVIGDAATAAKFAKKGMKVAKAAKKAETIGKDMSNVVNLAAVRNAKTAQSIDAINDSVRFANNRAKQGNVVAKIEPVSVKKKTGTGQEVEWTERKVTKIENSIDKPDIVQPVQPIPSNQSLDTATGFGAGNKQQGSKFESRKPKVQENDNIIQMPKRKLKPQSADGNLDIDA